MKKLAMLTSALIALSAPNVHAEAYIGGKLGYTWLAGDCATDSSCSDDSMAGGIYAGYNFTHYLGLEVGYDLLGDFRTPTSIAPVDDKLSAFTLAPKLTLPLDEVDLYGKLGVSRVEYGEINDTTLLAAIGAEFELTHRILARLEYQRVNNITQGVIDNLNANSVFLGMTYKFGASEEIESVELQPDEVQPKPYEEEVKVAPVQVAASPEPVPATKLFQEYGVELFDSDSFELAPNSQQYFNWLVGVMKKYPQAHAEIIGHTDSRGSKHYNQALSERRAQSVAEYLYTQGIDASRITVRGEGEDRPKTTNDTAEGRMENRRVEVIIDQFEIAE